MEYVGSREWLDVMNRLAYLHAGGMLPPARVDPAPLERARPLGTADATACGDPHDAPPCVACRQEGGTL